MAFFVALSHTNPTTSVIDNTNLIWIHSFSPGMDHAPFQLTITPWTRAFPSYNKSHGVLSDKSHGAQQTQSMCSILLESLLRTTVTIYSSLVLSELKTVDSNYFFFLFYFYFLFLHFLFWELRVRMTSYCHKPSHITWCCHSHGHMTLEGCKRF